MNYIKSCMNYTGGKYKLLAQLLPYFPNEIDRFYDIFCGGANVSINVESNQVICYDKVPEIIDLYNFIKNKNIDDIIGNITNVINKYRLSDTALMGYNYYGCSTSDGLQRYNKELYMELREDYNNKKYSNEEEKNIWFFVLIVFGFNNQIRFNSKKQFNIPVGKRDFNLKMRDKLIGFSERIKSLDISFHTRDFREVVNNNFNERDFVYADPPYLITNASYNESGGWSDKDELDLLQILDDLNERNIKFALSNVLECKGKENIILKEWAQKYTIHYLNKDYNNSNYQVKDKSSKTTEVLICNY